MEPPPGICKIPSFSPSAPKWVAKIPLPSSTSPTIAAAAPSPNRTQVFLSCISKIRDKVSAPITKIFLYKPVCAIDAAIVKPYINPLQAALISTAGIPIIPNLLCKTQAVLGTG